MRKDISQIISCSSPPCFLRELDPAYLGYLPSGEVLDLLADLLAVDLAGTRVEKAWVHAMLLRHTARIGGSKRPDGARPPSTLTALEHEQLGARLEDALPRLDDEALRQDLKQVLSMLKRDKQGGELRRYA
ncbi:MAG TPA: hypothetical protein VIL69_24225 [Roseomonas sp.]